MTRTALFLLLALAIPSVLAAEAVTVELTSGDGFLLTGTLWQGEASAPGILLLHQCDRDRSMYDDLGAKLSAAGFRVLAFDFRGFGESASEDFDLRTDAAPEDWQSAQAKFPEDVEAAYRFLNEQGEGSGVVGALGASCGGREVLALAEAHRELGRLAFLSSRLSALEMRAAMQMFSPSMLFIASRGDVRANQPAATIGYRIGRTRGKIILYDGDAHGYALLEQHPELADSIVTWFRSGLEAVSPRC